MDLIMVTHSITIVKINNLLFLIPCTYNQYQMFIIFLFMCPCLWTCKFSSCISINSGGFMTYIVQRTSKLVALYNDIIYIHYNNTS